MGTPQTLSEFLQQVFACAPDIADSIARRSIDRLYPLKAVILKQGDEYDLKFELVRAADSIHLASFEYSGAKQDLPSIRDRLQHDIFYYLQSRAASVQAINGSTNDPEAYKYYLQGLQLMPPRSNPDSLRQAQSAFQQAIAHDPNFAAAYAGIATAYLRLSFYTTAGGNQPPA